MKTPRRLPLLCLLPLLLAAAEYENLPPTARLTRPRLLAPRRVVTDTATFRLDVPRVALPFTQAEPVEVTLTVRHEDGREASATTTLRFSGNGMITGPSEIPIELSLSGWPDGTASASLRFPDPGEGPAVDPAPVTFRLQREALASIAEAHRDEMTVWFEEINRFEPIWGKRPLWPVIDRALAQPATPFHDLRGFLLRAYWNPQLERLQPYTVYVPHALPADAPAPLMILLHGSGGDYRNLIADYSAGQRFEDHPMLIANAGAFRNLEFRHLALNNVRWIIEDMQRKYNVDPGRIYVQGISLGGRGVLDLAALLPDTFAAVSSQGTYGIHRTLLDPMFPHFSDPVAATLAARNDIRTWMTNLGTTPVEMVFGWQDDLTRPVGALAIAATLQTLGHRVIERGFDLGHNLTLPEYDWATTREWFLRHRKDPLPRSLHFRVANLRHNRHAWLRIDALHDYSSVGEVQARFLPNGTLNLTTRNVARLSYLPPLLLLAGAEAFPAEAQTFHFTPDGSPADPPPARGGPVKHPGQSGPLWNIYSDPILHVYDDSLPDDLRRRVEQWARSSARSDAAPGPFSFPVRALSEVTEADRAAYNLLLFVHADHPHPWQPQLDVPLPPEVNALRAETPANLIAIRPSPWADNRLVLIAEAAHPQLPALPHMHFFQEHLQPDWFVAEGNRILAAGAFDHHWQPGPWARGTFITRILTR